MLRRFVDIAVGFHYTPHSGLKLSKLFAVGIDVLLPALYAHPMVNNVLRLRPNGATDEHPFAYENLIIQTNHRPRSKMIKCLLKGMQLSCEYTCDNDF